MEHTELYYINSVRNETYYDKYLGSEETLSPYKAELKKYVCNCDCMMNPIGSSYCCFSIKGANKKPLVVFSKSARKRNNVISVCSCSQAAIFDCSLEKFNSGLECITEYPLYSEEQIDLIAQGEPVGSVEAAKDSAVPAKVICPPNVIRAVMYRVAQRWLMGEKQLTIAVPASVFPEDYNAYVLGAVKTLYSYFPTMMKIEAGFSSYLAPEKYKAMQRIHLVFLPDAEATGEKLYLDGSNGDFADRIISGSALPEGIRIFIDTIVGIKDEAKRKEFLNSIFYEVESRPGFTPTDYTKCGREISIGKLNITDPDSLISYAEYFAKANKGELLSRYYENKFREYVAGALQEETVLKYIEKNSSDSYSIDEKLNSVQKILPLLAVNGNIRHIVWEKCQSWLQIGAKKSDADVYSTKELLEISRKYGEMLNSLGGTEEAQKLQRMLINEILKQYVDEEKKTIGEIEKAGQNIIKEQTGQNISQIINKLHEEPEQFRQRLADITTSAETERKVKEIETAAIESVKTLYQNLIAEIDKTGNRLKKRENLQELLQLIESEKCFEKKYFGDQISQIKSEIRKIDDEIKKEDDERKEQEKQRAEEQKRAQEKREAEEKARRDRERHIQQNDPFDKESADCIIKNLQNKIAEEKKARKKAKKQFLIATIAASVLIVLIAVGAVFFKFNNPYDEKIKSLENDVEKYKTQVEEYEIQVEKYENQIEAFKTQVEACKNQAEELKNQADEGSTEQLDKLLEDINVASETITSLREENKTLLEMGFASTFDSKLSSLESSLSGIRDLIPTIAEGMNQKSEQINSELDRLVNLLTGIRDSIMEIAEESNQNEDIENSSKNVNPIPPSNQ